MKVTISHSITFTIRRLSKRLLVILLEGFECPAYGLEVLGSMLIHIVFAHAEDACLVLTYVQMPYDFETSNNVVSYDNPHECI